MAVENAALNVRVSTMSFCQVFELLRRDEITDFFMDLPDHAFQKGFITFAVTAKKSYHAWVQDLGNIVA